MEKLFLNCKVAISDESHFLQILISRELKSMELLFYISVVQCIILMVQVYVGKCKEGMGNKTCFLCLCIFYDLFLMIEKTQRHSTNICVFQLLIK